MPRKKSHGKSEGKYYPEETSSKKTSSHGAEKEPPKPLENDPEYRSLVRSYFAANRRIAALTTIPPDGTGGPDPDGNGSSGPGPARTIYPDVAFEFESQFGLTQQDINDLTAAIQGANPGATVRSRPISEGKTQVGIWLGPTGDAAALDRGLDGVLNLGPSRLWRFFVWSGFVKRLVAQQWRGTENLHHFDHNGRPNASGPVHLQDISVDFSAPNHVVTVISGYDETPWPDVSFRLITAEDIRLRFNQNSALHELSVDSRTVFDPDTGIEDILSFVFFVLQQLFTAGALLLFPPLGWLAALAGLAQIGFATEGIVINSQNPGAGDLNIGGEIAKRFPQTQLIPQGLKLGFDYNTVDVSILGVSAGAAITLVPRQPYAHITGPRSYDYVTNQRPMLTFRYQVRTADLRPRIQATWRAPGGQIIPLTASSDSVYITFVLRNVQRGQTLVKDISVDVRDPDGVAASANTTLTISVMDPDDVPDPLPRPRGKGLGVIPGH